MRKIFYLLLTLFFIFLWFRLVNVREAVILTLRANIFYIVLAAMLGFVQSFLSSLRLKTLLSIIGKVSILYIWPLSFIGALISLIFPFSIGGFAMTYFISRKLKTSYPKTFSILFVDYILPVLLTLALALLALLYFSQKKVIAIRTDSLLNMNLLIIFGLIILILFSFFKLRISFFKKLFTGLKRGFNLFSNAPLILGKAASLTLLVAILGFIQFYLYFIAFGMYPNAIAFLLANSLFGVLGLIPGAPTKLGQYETLGVLTLPYLLSLDKNSVFAALLTAHMISISSVLIVGLFSTYYMKIDVSLIRKMRLRVSSKL